MQNIYSINEIKLCETANIFMQLKIYKQKKLNSPLNIDCIYFDKCFQNENNVILHQILKKHFKSFLAVIEKNK